MKKFTKILAIIANGFSKFIVANVAVVLVIMLLPVFLITDDVAFMDQIMAYLFSDKS